MADRGAATALMRAGNTTCHGLVQRTSGSESAAAGLSRGPSLGVVPGRRLGRQATLSKGYRLLRPPAALPLFDMSVAVVDSLNLMRASIEDEMVLESALGVPAHHALQCRIEAYGTPLGAPALHQMAAASDLTDDDKEFAACLAAPPDFDVFAETSFSLQRMTSISAMQRTTAPTESTAGGARLAVGDVARAAKGAVESELQLLRSPSLQHSDSMRKKSARLRGLRQDSDARDSVVGFEEAEEDAEQQEQQQQQQQRQVLGESGGGERLLAGTTDLVAALVGAGYLLLRAAGFNRRAPAAVGQLSFSLRRSLSTRSAMPPGSPLFAGARFVAADA